MVKSSQQAPSVAIVGAGPVGLITALGLAKLGIATTLYEDDPHYSLETKAGTILTRSLEIFRRLGVADAVLSRALRVEEIGEIDRATGKSTYPLALYELSAETRYPFVINLPQQYLEPVLAECAIDSGLVQIRMGHRLERFEETPDGATLHFGTADGPVVVHTNFLLACDGGRSTVRAQMHGVEVVGSSLPVKYSLVDMEVDLDNENPRDYPYLAYFADPQEWMILVRQPHCWRFLYPMAEGASDPTAEELRDKALRFIGPVTKLKVIQRVTYNVHHRVATKWRNGNVFLVGDAAHLVTPMWALGLNTGALDASNLSWRLAWFLRGWADARVLDGYENEQRPLAVNGAGAMAEAARLSMDKRRTEAPGLTSNNWSNAYTRTLLGVRLGVDDHDAWNIIVTETRPKVVAGDRLPDYLVHTPTGQPQRIHDVCTDAFTALYFCDVRRRPPIPANDSPALRHYAVSRWDAPFDSGLRDRSLLDPGSQLTNRLGVAANTLVLVRPDEFIAAMVPLDGTPDQAERLYEKIVGKRPVRANEP